MSEMPVADKATPVRVLASRPPSAFRQRLRDVRDFIVPMLDSPGALDHERLIAEEDNQIGLLRDREDGEVDEAVRALEKLMEGDAGRRQSAEQRLTSILGMTSIVAALSTTLLPIRLASSWTSGGGWQSKALIGLYVFAVFELWLAVLAALRGLRRRDYREPTPGTVLWREGEDRRTRLVRIAACLLSCRRANQARDNEKVGQLAVAHAAIRNFLLVLFLAAAVAVLF